jgi:hypothetical protein
VSIEGSSSSSDEFGTESDGPDGDGSFAETSLAERRRKNPGSIRLNSLIRISGIPPNCSSTELRVWLGHFAVSLQYLDFAEGSDTAVVRVANRRARDFFVKDFAVSQLQLKGQLLQASVLTPREFEEYFESLAETRRENIRTQSQPTVKAAPVNKAGKRTLLAVRKGWEKKARVGGSNGAAWTDVVAGNGNWAAPASSACYQVPLNRLEVSKQAKQLSPRSSYDSSSLDDTSPL